MLQIINNSPFTNQLSIFCWHVLDSFNFNCIITVLNAWFAVLTGTRIWLQNV